MIYKVGFLLAGLVFAVYLLVQKAGEAIETTESVESRSEGQTRVAAALYCLFALLILLAKSHYTHSQLTDSANTLKMDPRDWAWLVASISSFISCFCFTGRFLPLTFWLFNLFVSVLLWVDVLFYRYFDDIPGAYMLNGLNTGGGAAPSAWVLRKKTDLWLFVDLIPTALAGVWLSWRLRVRTSVDKSIALMWLVALLSFHSVNFIRLDSSERRLFRLRFRNAAIMEEIGIFNYHLYDLLQAAQSRWGNLLNTNYDQAFLQQILKESRQSMSPKIRGAGVAKGKNLLVIQLESFEWFVLNLRLEGQEITPFLNQLSKECLCGPMQDQTGQGRSSDGEFVYNNSLLPPGERPLVYAYPNNRFHGLPAHLKEAGYYTVYTVPYYGSFWNCRFMSGSYGFEHHLLKDDFRSPKKGEEVGWGLGDRAIFKQLVPKLKALPKPFYAYVVTLMNHHPYEELEKDEFFFQFSKKYQDTMLERYLNMARLRDDHLRDIVRSLKESGLWDSTIIVMMGDHDSRVPNEEMALLQADGVFDDVTKCEQDRPFLLIHVPNFGPQQLNKSTVPAAPVGGTFPIKRGEPGGKYTGSLPLDAEQVDLAPTLMHLLGIDGSKTCFFGQSLLARPRTSNRYRVTKANYALDKDEVAMLEGDGWVGYDRHSYSKDSESENKHRKLEKSNLAEKSNRWYEFVYDFLRLDLVPKAREMQTN